MSEPSSPAPAHDPIPLEPARPITDDLPCAVCGYNLKGLPSDGDCPECGKTVDRTTRPQLTRSDPAWLRSQARNLFFLGAVWGVSYDTGYDLSVLRHEASYALPLAVSLLFVAAWGAITVYGAWRLSAPEAGELAVEGAGDPWRRGLRLACMGYAITFALLLFPRSTEWQLRTPLSVLAFASMGAMLWLIPLHLHRLAVRAGDGSLVAHARLARWALPAQLLLRAAFNFVITPRDPTRYVSPAVTGTTQVVATLLTLLATVVMIVFVLLLGRLHEALCAAARGRAAPK